MKQKRFITAIGVSLLAVLSQIEPAYAQHTSLPGKHVYITNKPAQWSEDSVWVDMNIEIHSFTIDDKNQLVLTPLLISEEKSMMFPPVVLNGKLRYKLHQRSLALDKHPGHECYASINLGDGVASRTIHYVFGMPSEPWMRDASLVMEQSFCGCNDQSQQIFVEMIAQHFVPETPVPTETFTIPDPAPLVTAVEPQLQVIDSRLLSDKASVAFHVAKANIVAEYANNHEELEVILRRLESLTKEGHQVQINRLQIVAYASPEGSQTLNRVLSWRRAEALASWLKSNYNLKSTLVEYWGEGEDWAMLLKLIREDATLSDADKQQLEHIIGAVDDPEARERRIMRYKDGEIYRYLSTHLYPLLRRSDYRIEYTTQP